VPAIFRVPATAAHQVCSRSTKESRDRAPETGPLCFWPSLSRRALAGLPQTRAPDQPPYRRRSLRLAVGHNLRPVPARRHCGDLSSRDRARSHKEGTRPGSNQPMSRAPIQASPRAWPFNHPPTFQHELQLVRNCWPRLLHVGRGFPFGGFPTEAWGRRSSPARWHPHCAARVSISLRASPRGAPSHPSRSALFFCGDRLCSETVTHYGLPCSSSGPFTTLINPRALRLHRGAPFFCPSVSAPPA
jgi:hypothetical protein